jgi:hypothetical protein
MTDSSTWSPDGLRFNPPPGWPVPAKGWVPPPHWQPDPSWPPPPPGWPLWIPVGYPTQPLTTPPAVTPPPSAKRPKLILASKILAGVITFAATIVGTYVAVTDRPSAYTMDDWARKANAVCDQNFGNLQTPIFALTPMLAQAIATPSAQGNPAGMSQMITTVLEISGAFRKMNGDIRGIDLPKDTDAASVNRLLDAGTQVSTALSTVANFLTNFQQGKATTVEGTATVQSLQQVNSTSLPAWTAEVSHLGLNQCLSIVGTPAPSTPSGPTAAQIALSSAVKTTVAKDCVANPAAGGMDQVAAAINCAPVAAGLSLQPLLIQFTSANAMNTYVDSLNTPTTSADCVDGKGRGYWYHDDVRMGALICQVQSGAFRITWAFEGRNVVVIADGADAATTYAWWQDNANLLTSP